MSLELERSGTPNGKTQTRDMNKHFTHTHTESKILIIESVRKKYLTFQLIKGCKLNQK